MKDRVEFGSVTRRRFLQGAGAAVTVCGLGGVAAAAGDGAQPLAEFGYGQVAVTGARYRAQLDNTHSILMGMSNDSLLRPFRVMAGLPAPGEELGGWYTYNADFDYHVFQKTGFCPGANFGHLRRRAAHTRI